MDSPDIRKQMSKAYLYMNSQAILDREAYQSTPARQNYFTPQWKLQNTTSNLPEEVSDESNLS